MRNLLVIIIILVGALAFGEGYYGESITASYYNKVYKAMFDQEIDFLYFDDDLEIRWVIGIESFTIPLSQIEGLKGVLEKYIEWDKIAKENSVTTGDKIIKTLKAMLFWKVSEWEAATNNIQFKIVFANQVNFLIIVFDKFESEYSSTEPDTLIFSIDNAIDVIDRITDIEKKYELLKAKNTKNDDLFD